MSRVLAAILLAFVVFAFGDPVDVEKRLVPVGPHVPGLDLLGKGGLSGDLLKPLLLSLAEFIKSVRKSLESLNICPHKQGDYKAGGGGHNEPGYAPDYVPDYKPGYEPGYEPGYQPSYLPSGKYKRGVEHSKVDLACELIKPLIEALVKIMRQLEKILACMLGKDQSYKGDYKECQQGSGYDHSHGYKSDYPNDYKSGYPNDYKSGYPNDYKSGY